MIIRPITRPLTSSISRHLAGGTVTPPGEPTVPSHAMLPVLGTAAVKKVWFDNDEEDDTYTTESVIAAHLAGRLQLVGFSSTAATSTVGSNPTLPDAYFNQDMTDRATLLTEMAQSGWNMSTVPALETVFKGAFGAVATPRSATTRVNHPAAQHLVDAVHAHATASQPLVIICGGQLTVVADAWLLDPTIATKCVVMFVSGDPSIHPGGYYNEWADATASIIVHESFTMVHFPATWPNVTQPVVTKAQLLERLPQSPLRVHMNAKTRTGNSLPGDMDGDGNPIVCLLNPGLIRSVTRKTASGTTGKVNASTTRQVSALTDDPLGKIHHCEVRQTATGCVTVKDSAVVTFTGTGGGLFVGQSVQGSGIPAGAKITATDGSTTATLSIAASLDGTGVTLMLNSKTGTDTWWENITRPALWTRGLTYNLNTLASDSFTGTDGSALGTGWIQLGSIARNQIVSNTAGKTTTGYAFDIRNDSYPNGDQYVQMRFTANPTASYFPAVAVRAAFHSGSDVNGYYLYPNSTTDSRLQRSQSAVNTVILSGMPVIASGQYWRVTAVGNLIGVWQLGGAGTGVYHSGWRLHGIIQDTALAAGKPALLNSRSAGPTTFGDDFSSGSITV